MPLSGTGTAARVAMRTAHARALRLHEACGLLLLFLSERAAAEGLYGADSPVKSFTTLAELPSGPDASPPPRAAGALPD